MTRATAAAKRTSSVALQGAAKGKAPKAAKIAAVAAAAAATEIPPCQAPPEPAPEWCRPVFDLLDFLDGSLPAACVAMFRAAAPHALGAVPGELHAYQAKVADSLAGVCAEALKSHRAAAESSEAAVSALLQDKGRAAEQLASATRSEEAKREAKGGAAAANKAADEALAAKRRAMEAARKQLEEVQSLAQAVSEAKAEFEKDTEETWAPLKAGAFPPKEWRARQKAIARACERLAQAAIPASLAAAVPLALKEKPESRTEFAAQVVEHAEMALHEHVASITVQLDSHQATVDAQTQAVAAAEGEVKAAEAELDATVQAQIEAENAWVEADSTVRDLKAAIGSFGQRSEQLDAELAASKAALEKLQSLVGRFEGLRDGAEARPMETAAAEASEDASAEAPADEPADTAAQPPAEPPAEAPAELGAQAEEGRVVGVEG